MTLSHTPTFPYGVPFARPSQPPLEDVMARLQPSYDLGILTNGPLVRLLEERCAERLGVRHVVAVSSCTSGLMLAIRSFGLTGSVVLPSFTFSASAHALVWNGLRPVFAECDPYTLQLDLVDAFDRLDGAGLILATHVFGAPCRAESVTLLGRASQIPVIFDAAHGFGARRQGVSVGTFGDVEVFSLSPTKPLVAGEGGLVATNDDLIAHMVRLGRDYGNPGDYNTQFAGINARMSELHAATALESLCRIDENLERRRAIADRYTAALAALPGIVPQAVDAGDESTWKDFTVLVEAEVFGMTRDDVAAALRDEGIDTRRYFYPPVHRQAAYAEHFVDLPVTDRAASMALSLPMFTSLELTTVDMIVEVLAALHERADEPRDAAAAPAL